MLLFAGYLALARKNSEVPDMWLYIVPVYAVGYGSEKPVPDIAVSRVMHPSSVFVEDRVKGEIVIGEKCRNEEMLGCILAHEVGVRQGSKYIVIR